MASVDCWQIDANGVNLGPYPHAAIDKRGRKKQGTRMLKAVCPNPDCALLVKLGKPLTGRFSQQIADMGLPVCVHCGTQMTFANGAGEHESPREAA